jgi:hypothetical protein
LVNISCGTSLKIKEKKNKNMAVEKTTIGCGGDEICCMHIDANIETFLKIAEALGWTIQAAVPA